MADCILCIDIGTSSLKAAYMADSPKSIAFARYNFKNSNTKTFANEWIYGLAEALKELKEKSPDTGIEAICISGNGPTLCSEDGTTLMWNQEAPTSVQNSKSIFLPRIDGFRKKYPTEWHNTNYIFSGPEFLIHQLTGAILTILPEERYEEIYWTKEQLNQEGFSDIEIKKLPSFVKSGALAGKINSKAAEITGLLEGTLVFCGGPDFIVALLGTDTLDTGLMCDRSGSSEGINLCTPEPLNYPGIRVLPSIIPGMWNAGIIIPDTGSRFATFKEKVEHYLKEPITHKNLITLITENNEKDSNIKLSEELKKEGNTIIYDVTHQLWAAINILQKASEHASIPKPKSITITGGQALNEKWTQIKCDTLCIPITVTECVDAELAGDNILARVSLGYYDSLEEAAFALVKKSKIYTPKMPADQD
ncbi:MAG: hypothetical protein J6J11_10165 [Treponema sp.]|nr:hypothetical protein [Treponema sp.]